jgi:short-subunit dehydrogenase
MNQLHTYLTESVYLQAFVEKFSRDLYAEVKNEGIYIQTIHPGYVYTSKISFKQK